jgi:hypothetical protein
VSGPRVTGSTGSICPVGPTSLMRRKVAVFVDGCSGLGTPSTEPPEAGPLPPGPRSCPSVQVVIADQVSGTTGKQFSFMFCSELVAWKYRFHGVAVA